MGTARILVVDDEPQMADFLRTLLEVYAFDVETAAGGLEAVERVQRSPFPDLVLLDVVMPEVDGLQTLEILNKVRPGIKVVMLSCLSDPKTVVKAIRMGALDYLPKPFQKTDLETVIRRALNGGTSHHEPTIPESGEDVGDGHYFLVASQAMQKVRAQVDMVAGVDVPVLILGESGTGKEVVARLVHKLSPRANEPFLKVNCAALPSELLESELFGYEPGAFTGAIKSKPGRFEMCNKGTIFLDEIGEMSVGLQAKLLHVLQDHRFSRLGGRSVIKVDVRVLAATNVNIPEALASKKLREDTLLPIEYHHHQPAPLARASRSDSLASSPLYGSICRTLCARPSAPHIGDRGRSHEAFMARQFTGDGKLCEALPDPRR